MVSLESRIVKGAGTVFLMMLGNISFGFLVRITLARKLPLEEFGLFYAVFAFLGLVGLLKNLGLNNAVIKFIPEFLINKEEDKVKTSILFTLFFSIITSIIIGTIFYIFSHEISIHYFHDPIADKALKILVVFFIVSALVSFLNSLFNAFQRPLLLSYSGLFVNLALFILVIITKELDIFYLCWYNNIIYIVVLIFNITFLHHIFNLFKYRAFPIKPVAKKLFPFGLASMSSSIVSHATLRLDTIFLTFFQDLAAVGVYSALTPFGRIFRVFGSSVSKIFFPISSELYGQGKTDELKSVLGKIHRNTLLLLTPLAAIFIAYSGFIIETIFGSEFVSGLNAARIIVIGSLISPISIINVGTINGLGYPFKNTIIVTISGVTNIIFHIILIPLWGYNGAAIAFLLNRVVRVTASHYYLNKIIGYKHNHRLLFGIFSAGIFLCGSLLSAHTVFHKTGICLMILQYTFVSLVGIFLYFVLCIALNIASFNEIKRMGNILFKR